MKNEIELANEKSYSEIGKFVVYFEYVTHKFLDCITIILQKSGLQDKSAVKIILDRLTADSIKTKFDSLVANFLDKDDPKQKVVKPLLKQYSDLVEIRNLFIHGLWLLSPASYNDKKKYIPHFIGIKQRVKSKNISFYNIKGDIEIIELINLRVSMLLDLVVKLENDLVHDSCEIIDDLSDVKATIDNINNLKFNKILAEFKTDPIGKDIYINNMK
jgi:hypothetical protein